MSRSISSPATRSERETTTPPIDNTATSDVPPPISTTMLPRTSLTGKPAPRAAAFGSSINPTSRAPADIAASYTARFSTSVAPDYKLRQLFHLFFPHKLKDQQFPNLFSSIAWVI